MPLLRLSSSPTHEHFGHFSVVVVEEKALARVEGLNLSHIIGTQFEVEDVMSMSINS